MLRSGKTYRLSAFRRPPSQQTNNTTQQRTSELSPILHNKTPTKWMIVLNYNPDEMVVIHRFSMKPCTESDHNSIPPQRNRVMKKDLDRILNRLRRSDKRIQTIGCNPTMNVISHNPIGLTRSDETIIAIAVYVLNEQNGPKSETSTSVHFEIKN